MTEFPAGKRLEILRRSRRLPEAAPSIAADMQRAAKEFEREERRDHSAAEAWAVVCPEGLARRVTLVGIARGVMSLTAENASTRFELDRFLRGGGERALIAACRASVKKVRIVTR